MICPLGGAVVHIKKFSDMQSRVQVCRVHEVIIIYYYFVVGWGIKAISMERANRLDWSSAQVLQLQEVDLSEHGHCHGMQSGAEVCHVGHQNGQHEEHK